MGGCDTLLCIRWKLPLFVRRGESPEAQPDLIPPLSFCTEPQSIALRPDSPYSALGLLRNYSGIYRSDVMSRKLFVGNLAFSMGESELKQLFENKGEVESLTIMRDLETGRSRGFAFVEMSTEEDAQKAIKELNGFAVEGRNLAVNEARPRQEKRGGGGGGGYRGGNRGGGGRRRDPRW